MANYTTQLLLPIEATYEGNKATFRGTYLVIADEDVGPDDVIQDSGIPAQYSTCPVHSLATAIRRTPRSKDGRTYHVDYEWTTSRTPIISQQQYWDAVDPLQRPNKVSYTTRKERQALDRYYNDLSGRFNGNTIVNVLGERIVEPPITVPKSIRVITISRYVAWEAHSEAVAKEYTDSLNLDWWNGNAPLTCYMERYDADPILEGVACWLENFEIHVDPDGWEKPHLSMSVNARPYYTPGVDATPNPTRLNDSSEQRSVPVPLDIYGRVADVSSGAGDQRKPHYHGAYWDGDFNNPGDPGVFRNTDEQTFKWKTWGTLYLI